MRKEIVQAIVELKHAEQNFQYADKEFVQIAIFQLIAAESKVNVLIALKVGKKKADPLRENPLSLLKKLSVNIIPQQKQTVRRKIQVKAVNSVSNKKKYLTLIGKNF